VYPLTPTLVNARNVFSLTFEVFLNRGVNFIAVVFILCCVKQLVDLSLQAINAVFIKLS